MFYVLPTLESNPVLTLCLLRRRTPDAHAVERAVDEDEGDGEESGREDMGQAGALCDRHLDGELDSEQAKECRELDDRIERN
jgi:hypothetical protein